jgi:hypothetical protein
MTTYSSVYDEPVPEHPAMADAELTALAVRNGYHYEIKDYGHAARIASFAGPEYRPVDGGHGHWPRYGIVRQPQIGDLVSKSFNGDTYIVGRVVSVSPTGKVVTTRHDDGRTWTFYRRGLTGAWLNGGMWSLVRGHHEERNPHF